MIVILCWMLAIGASAQAREATYAYSHFKDTLHELVKGSLVNLPSPPEQTVKAIVLFCLTTDGIHHQQEVNLTTTKELHTNTYERNPFYRLATINAP